jgi:predicted TIM-barrel fold metal-dependent hydrolase
LTIDTHHHMLPDFFWRETNDSHAPVGGLTPLHWSKEVMISFMDDAGIDVAVMSVSTPGVHLGNSEKARSLARRCNEFAAELVHTRPDRFASFACIPLPDIDASLEELSYGRRGTGEAYCLAHHITVDGRQRRLMVASLRYLDTFVKMDGAWLFSERRLYVDWLEERALHNSD